jgi:5-formyltetrahydrofolate cyclo-ligase
MCCANFRIGPCLGWAVTITEWGVREISRLAEPKTTGQFRALQSPNPSIANEKAALRREMRTLMGALSGAGQAGRSAAIRAHLAASPHFQRAKRIALFRALPGEPDLAALTTAPGRRFAFPRIEADELTFYIPNPESDWLTTAWGVIEPNPARSERMPAHQLDLVVVPGLAFSIDGHRLGRGRGYYDRFLARLPCDVPRVAAGFACQLRSHVPADAHDERLDAVVTESGWHVPRGSRLEARDASI